MAKNLNWDNFWDNFEAIYLEDASFSEKQVSFKLQVIFSANFRLKAKKLLEPFLRKISKCLILG